MDQYGDRQIRGTSTNWKNWMCMCIIMITENFRKQTEEYGTKPILIMIPGTEILHGYFIHQTV